MSTVKLKQKICQIQKLGQLNQDNVGAVMRLFRSALEEQKKKGKSTRKFWHLWFFCTWCAGHHELTKDFSSILSKAYDVLIYNQKDRGEMSYNDMMADMLNLKKLRLQANLFCKSHSIDCYLFSDIRNWVYFSAFLRQIISEVKISFPDNLENLKPEQIKIYKKMEAIPNGRGCKAFWVTTTLDEKGKFDSYWNMSLFKENILIQGRLFINEQQPPYN